jgi:Pyruvate/2-oxoacid:ferredoxin oxidoreductase delta subunit
MAYSINEKCTGCTACVNNCPVFAVSGEKGSRHVINAKRCVDCGVCGKVCNQSAIANNEGDICLPQKRSTWPKPVININLCNACQICVHDCFAHALKISLPLFKGDIDVYAELAQSKLCSGCGICEKHCPVGAVTMKSEAAL